MHSIAIVILNYNGRLWLELFLPSVIHHSGLAKIVVADNCSTDDSIALLKERFPSVVRIEIPSNLGFCGGYNFALRQVKEKYYVLLNSDVEVTSGWLEPIFALFETDEHIAAAQPKILSYQNKARFEYAGAAGGYIDALGYPFCRGRIFGKLEEDQGQYNDVRPVFWATGACLFIRSEVYHRMNGLDEDFFAHMEEIDLCWRLHRAGYAVYYHGGSTVYHVGGGTLAASNPNKTYLNYRNGLSLIFKNLSPFQLMWKLPLRIALDWISAFKFLSEGSVANFLAVGKAHLHFIKRINRDSEKRKEAATRWKYHAKQIYKRSLVFDFYILGKRHFSDMKFSRDFRKKN